MLLKADKQNSITVAVDGNGGDRDALAGIGKAAKFALTLYPGMKLIVYGARRLEEDLARGQVLGPRCEFRTAAVQIPQDESPRSVLSGYSQSSMRKAVECVKEGEAQAVISAGGTGPLVVLSRHILGTIGRIRPALCAKIPAGPGRFSLMLDLGANARCTPEDLCCFARLGTAAGRVILGESEPTCAVLNIGSELGKGNELVQGARGLISSCKGLRCNGFTEADRLFTGDNDIIVTDGFTGNIALKSAEGVARVFFHGQGLKRYFAKLARPEWLMPWQYNGSLLLGVRGTVVKSHASARQEALAVAIVEAAKAVKAGLCRALEEDPLIRP